MYKLLSLPPNLVADIYDIETLDKQEWFCSSDPIDKKLGSGGGTTWLLKQWMERKTEEGLREKKIILHAGGQSRRLPGYAPSGKILTPIPVFRWARGQRLNQNLLALQMPLYEKILKLAPQGLSTLIASGDVYIRAEQQLQPIPKADVVCYGVWVNPELATHHGVFVSDRKAPEVLDFMLQKPSMAELEKLSKTHLFLMDIGIWLLSERAVKLLMKRSMDEEGDEVQYYDLYSDFGRSLGAHPTINDDELNKLSVAILPLPGGEFHHFGTSRELLSSTLTIQNKVYDQRQIMHHKMKPNPAIFVQNAAVEVSFTSANGNLWIENSHVPCTWQLGAQQIITGVPYNDWRLTLPDGVCLDVVPMKQGGWAVRPYGFDDAFKGALLHPDTYYLGKPFAQWMEERGVKPEALKGKADDLQAATLFPIIYNVEEMEAVIEWMTSNPTLEKGKQRWTDAQRISADEIAANADLKRLYEQRQAFSKGNLDMLAKNYEKSIFYQLDLEDVAKQYHRYNLPKPMALNDDAPIMQQIHNRMLRARIDQLDNRTYNQDEQIAFSLLRDTILAPIYQRKSRPKLNVYSDQIVWGRSPVRIDISGGWTDTPPYSLLKGGNVVNLAIELNGQPPLQVYIKPSEKHHIVLRSIDMGAIEVVTTFEQLADYKQVGSPFSIPKAALALAGFLPAFSEVEYASLQQQLEAFGTGMEITLLSAVPAGSGLGTSSVLAATVLGALNDFCALAWDKSEICSRTLALEQLLTTGGGWQDQYGGVLHGVKLLQTQPGFEQCAQVHWLPQHLFTLPEYRACHLLYYTGITRTAKAILAEIVRGMFLNSLPHLSLLGEMKQHALVMADAIQRNDFMAYGQALATNWCQNKQLDSGTNPPEVEAIIQQVKDYCLGYKLPGAGGGGFLYMVAKDPVAAARIRETLTQNPPNSRARFVEMTLSERGFQVSRS